MALLINESNPNTIDDFINGLKSADVWDDKKNYTRLKNKLKNIATCHDTAVKDELIKELDDEIKNWSAYM
jgi:hypothetical protein